MVATRRAHQKTLSLNRLYGDPAEPDRRKFMHVNMGHALMRRDDVFYLHPLSDHCLVQRGWCHARTRRAPPSIATRSRSRPPGRVHCDRECVGGRVPLPRAYVQPYGCLRRVGNFSFQCVMGYQMDHGAGLYDTPYVLMLVQKMAAEVWGRPGLVHPAPPRFCLRRFGGAVDPDDIEVLSERQQQTVVEAPFISWAMMVECKSVDTVARAVKRSSLCCTIDFPNVTTTTTTAGPSPTNVVVGGSDDDDDDGTAPGCGRHCGADVDGQTIRRRRVRASTARYGRNWPTPRTRRARLKPRRASRVRGTCAACLRMTPTGASWRAVSRGVSRASMPRPVVATHNGVRKAASVSWARRVRPRDRRRCRHGVQCGRCSGFRRRRSRLGLDVGAISPRGKASLASTAAVARPPPLPQRPPASPRPTPPQRSAAPPVPSTAKTATTTRTARPYRDRGSVHFFFKKKGKKKRKKAQKGGGRRKRKKKEPVSGMDLCALFSFLFSVFFAIPVCPFSEDRWTGSTRQKKKNKEKTSDREGETANCRRPFYSPPHQSRDPRKDDARKPISHDEKKRGKERGSRCECSAKTATRVK